MRLRPTAFIVLLATLLPASLASARLSEEYGYDYDQVWRAAVRLVAVDLRFPITDRDEEIGYVLFQYEDQGRSHHGSIELVRTAAPDGRERVSVAVQVPGMPSYVERMILDRFTRKLLQDYGPPRASRPAPPAPPVRSGRGDAPADRAGEDEAPGSAEGRP